MSAPLRRTRGDLIAAGLIGLICTLALAVAVLTAPIRGTEARPAPGRSEEPSLPSLAATPEGLVEAWSVREAPLPGLHRPIVSSGLVVAVDEHGASAKDPRSGEEVWSYHRAEPLCAAASAWSKVVLTYRVPSGCGDVVALTAQTGEYSATRSAPAPAEATGFSSNDRVGTLAPARLELWRSDMVRTVEYGAVPNAQEPGLQPHPECSLTSALTRKKVLALTEACPDGSTHLRMLKATPESAREPEITGEVEVPRGSFLVAVGEGAAAIWEPGRGGAVRSYRASGAPLESRGGVGGGPVAASISDPADHGAQSPGGPESVGRVPATPGLSQPLTGDLPHHMTWFDGASLHLFSPSTLRHIRSLPDARGTGVAVGGELLYPTDAGIAVVDEDSGERLREITLDRGGAAAGSLAIVGDVILEKRLDDQGPLLVALRADVGYAP